MSASQESISSTEISQTQVSTDAPVLAPLLKALPGAIIYTKSSPNYGEKRRVFNRDSTAQPLAIVSPRNKAEVKAVVKFCATNRIPMSVRGGGHDLSGRSLVENGVVIDMSAFDTITISEDRAFARIGAGVLANRLTTVLDDHGLYTPHGWCDLVGYVGWACGGGYGLSTGQYGLGAHQLLGARIVTPSGDVVDTDNDDELLWAIRGAGNGNFGVVLEVRTKVYTRPQALAGVIIFPLSEGREVLSKFENLCQHDLPDQFSGELLIVASEGLGLSITFLFQYLLDEDDHTQALEYKQKVAGLGTVLVDNVAETTPHAFFQAVAPAFRFDRYLNFNSVSTAGFSEDAIDILMRNPVTENSGILFHHAHGRAILPKNAAYAARERHFVWGINGAANLNHTDEEKKTAFEWSDTINNEVRARGLALDQGYWSFTPSKYMDTLKWYGKENMERLKELKDKYNPGNAFPQAYPSLP
ncbi:hypothetical protein F4779DRAFT_629751 [Xylariaceae sp. FL0662B]|nr:hypothetical protein F4779DRAFT_629751 [Xylariaceae sp. FL0662B]